MSDFIALVKRALNSRPVRTFAQATAAAMIVALADGGSWSDLPQAASVGAFAGVLSLLMLIAGPLKPPAGQ